MLALNRLGVVLGALLAGALFAPVINSKAHGETPAPSKIVQRQIKPAGQPPAQKVDKVQRHEAEKRHANDHVVSVLGSGITGTYAQFAEDIRNVLEAGKRSDLRVVPILGRSAGQNLVDIVFLKGVDMGIVDQDALFYLKKKDPLLYGDVDQRVHYIAKVFDSEFHLVARKEINSLADLRGKKVNCLQELAAASMVCEALFDALKLPVEVLHLEAEQALTKLRHGEIAAAARVGGAPIPGFAAIKPEDNLHFVPISRQNLSPADFDKVRALYSPARLKHEHYPQLIPEGESVPTVATGAVLAVYNWPRDASRHDQLVKFVTLFFENIDKFRQAPRHAKWKDVNLAAETPGWRRFKPAQDWLNAHRRNQQVASTGSAEMNAAFTKYVRDYMALRNVKDVPPDQKRALFAQFRTWWDAQNAPSAPLATVVPSAPSASEPVSTAPAAAPAEAGPKQSPVK